MSKSKKASKIKPAELYRDLAVTINSHLWPMPSKFHIIESEPGKKQILEEYEPQTVRYVVPQRLVDMVVQYTSKEFPESSRWAFTEKQAKDAVQFWLAITKPTEKIPAIVSEKKFEGLTFRRLPFDFDIGNTPTPTFDDFMTRCSNSNAIMAWIGSLFYPNADRQQYVWIHGEGGEGKGSLARLLTNIFGHAASSKQPPTKGDKFWTYSLLGKRLVIMPDCEDYKFPNEGLFKSLTGGDAISFEAKGQMPFSATPTCMFLYLSNKRPDITGQKANRRRIIYGAMEPITGEPKPQFVIDALLWEEASAIIGKCINKYEELCPDLGVIKADDAILDDLIGENEDAMEVRFHKHFLKDPASHVISARFQEIKKHEKLYESEYRNWLAYMKRVHGISPVMIGHQRVRAYKGIALRPDSSLLTMG